MSGKNRPEGFWEVIDDDFVVPCLTVFEEDEETFTGLVDARGDPIHRNPLRGRLGFDLGTG